ncbi:MAG TPA: peptidoglycan-associated lipoprotein Pal [Candidatus Competibacteraceae bacterium]|nr:peptidoglycan-associated lipoprotein Pal [Candidatus Competibacteraceae bacterium]
MNNCIRILMAAASLALLASCASTGENTDPIPQDMPQSETTGQPGQEAYSYAYGQAPGGYDTYDTSSGTYGSYPGGGTSDYGQSGLPAQPQPPEPAMPGMGGSMVSADRIVYFDFDSANVRSDSQAIIESNANYLRGNPRIITQLEGHTDERGSREYNIALGERRANAVRQVMSAMGVSPQQIRVVSYGEERPAASGSDEQSYALNRRVEIVY